MALKDNNWFVVTTIFYIVLVVASDDVRFSWLWLVIAIVFDVMASRDRMREMLQAKKK